MSFKELGLSDLTLKAITELGYTEPTPVQQLTIPHVLKGSDVVGIAQTGTGKTASFALPMLDILSSGKAKARMPRSLILAPTRELATQIGENFVKYGKYHKISMALLIGGESVTDQKKILSSGVDVLIATPGRMIDMFERGQIIMTGIKMVVIDEADRMLDMGFIPDVKKILSWVKTTRQVLLFSATMDKEIKEIAEKFMTFPKEIFVSNPSTAAKTVNHTVVYTADATRKRKILCDIINSENIKNAMIFCNKKREVSSLYNVLRDKHYSVCQFHGDMNQHIRTATIEAFKNGDFELFVCSDAAARGLDLPDVSHVFLYDAPYKPEDYVHRIGRTGRAGKEGKAFTLISDDDFKALAAVEKNLGRPVILNKDFGDPSLYKERKIAAAKSKFVPKGNPNKHGPKPAALSKLERERKEKQERQRQEQFSRDDEQRLILERRRQEQKQLREANPYISLKHPVPASAANKHKQKKGSSGSGRAKDKVAFGEHMPAFFGIKLK